MIVHQCVLYVPDSGFHQWKRVVCLCLRFRWLFEEVAGPDQSNLLLHLLGSVEERVGITSIDSHSQLQI